MSLEELSEPEIEKLWLEEALRSDEEIEAGKVELRKAEDVFRGVRKRLS